MMGVVGRNERRRGTGTVAIVPSCQFSAGLLDGAAMTGRHKFAMPALGTDRRISLQKKLHRCGRKDFCTDIAPFGDYRTLLSDLALHRQEPRSHRRDG